MAKLTPKEKQIINQGGSLDEIKSKLDSKPLTPAPVIPPRPEPGSRGDFYDCLGNRIKSNSCVDGSNWCSEDDNEIYEYQFIFDPNFSGCNNQSGLGDCWIANPAFCGYMEKS